MDPDPIGALRFTLSRLALSFKMNQVIIEFAVSIPCCDSQKQIFFYTYEGEHIVDEDFGRTQPHGTRGWDS